MSLEKAPKGTIDTFVYNLRRKIEADPSAPRRLVTVPWPGYKFAR